MEKRYQVFVSSTYADLRDERARVIQALMEMDCIPAGMELFPAADEEQWAFIKRVIDDCDYYLLIIGGRYGSTTPDGISYTEKEYDYAIQRGLKVLAFVHEKPEVIPVGKSDIDPELRARLGAFRDKVSTGRLVKFWTATEQLPGLVALSLSKTMKAYPAVGWVRADQIGSAELLAEVNELRKQNEELRRAAQAPRETKPAVKNLAGLDARVKLSGKHKVSSAHSQSAWQVELTWAQLFGLLGPYLFHYPADDYVKGVLGRSLHEEARQTGYDVSLRDQDFQTVKVQLAALGLVDIQYTQSTKGGMGLFWSLTPAGQALIYELRTIKAD